MKCLYCQGQMKKGTAPLHIDRHGCHLMLERVCAWVCEQCGEAYFESREVDAVQDILRSIDAKASALELTG
jgi:YgiT-type zinc finger domain-containing protein